MRRGSATMIRAPSRRRRFIREAKTGVRVRRVGPDEQHDVTVLDGCEVLGARRRAERLVEAIPRGGVAHASAGVDVVVAEGRSHHLLDDVDLLVGAARGRDAADGTDAVPGLDGLEPGGDPLDRLVPGHRAPVVVDRVADHRREPPVAVRGVAVGEATLDARVALVRAAGLARHHPDHPGVVTGALHLRPEGAADTAVGAGRVDGPGRHAQLDDGLLGQGVGRDTPARRRRTRRTRTRGSSALHSPTRGSRSRVPRR